MDLRVNGSKFNQSFGVRISNNTCLRLYDSKLEVSNGRFIAMIKRMRFWGSNDSVISYRTHGINEDRFVLTNPYLSDKEVPLTDKVGKRGIMATFYEDINKEKILEAEQALIPD